MNILGISAFYHDSAAALLVDGKLIAAAQEERFTRKKHDPSFPTNAIKYCLEEANIALDEIDTVVFYDKPFLKFERLLETYYKNAPKGLKSFITAMPIWMKEKMFLKRLIRESLVEIGHFDAEKQELLFPEHHLSHAASAFYPSPFDEAAILTIDGVGEWATASICHGKSKDITIINELHFPHSVGLLYSAFTYFLGFRVNSGEYKLMGLAPYGRPNHEKTRSYINTITNKLCKVHDDGSITLDSSYFNYETGLEMVHDDKWTALFGFEKRKSESPIEQHHCDLAYAIQEVTEDVVLKMAKNAKSATGSENLCLAGGVALNCVANGKLQKANIFKNIFIQPAAGDAGGAVGAAYAAWHIHASKDRILSSEQLVGDAMSGAYLGPEYDDKAIKKVIKKYKASSSQYTDLNELANKTAQHIAQEKAVGWFQGRMEFGPRALGNRSILGDPRSAETQKKLNLQIKYRESFRPFAPSVLEEDASNYFDLANSTSPYMLLVQQVAAEQLKELPKGYENLPLKEKLYVVRSSIPSITHVDCSARIQTVSRKTNPRYHALISAFKKLTGVGLVVNTSFNVRGEPIVCTPEDAYRCFMRTEMDVLVLGNFLFLKEEQPEWKEKGEWQVEFALD
jgi:carbamoyltransferase